MVRGMRTTGRKILHRVGQKPAAGEKNFFDPYIAALSLVHFDKKTQIDVFPSRSFIVMNTGFTWFCYTLKAIMIYDSILN